MTNGSNYNYHPLFLYILMEKTVESTSVSFLVDSSLTLKVNRYLSARSFWHITFLPYHCSRRGMIMESFLRFRSSAIFCLRQAVYLSASTICLEILPVAGHQDLSSERRKYSFIWFVSLFSTLTLILPFRRIASILFSML